jgi:hypothetical protein
MSTKEFAYLFADSWGIDQRTTILAATILASIAPLAAADA